MHTLDTACRDLKELLTEERNYLLRARLFDATNLAEKKAELLRVIQENLGRADQLNLSETTKRDLSEVKRIADENGTYLAALRNGVGSIVKRLRALDADDSLGAYDQHGKGVRFSSLAGRYMKKA
ncbi:MAG: hypothetical protein AAF950_14500 [Pseudomonadota bacterium]